MIEKITATYVGTGDKLVEKGPSLVHWITISPKTMGTAAEVRIHDGFDTDGREAWRIKPGYTRQYLFMPPLNCEQGVYVKCVDTIDSYTICYAPKKWNKERG